MSRLRLGALIRLIAPRSLRYQLLNRSLLILAVLLMLIGVLQYVIMKDFVFQNKAEALNAQIMSMPMEWFTGIANPEMDNNRPELNDPSAPSPADRPQRDHRDSSFLPARLVYSYY